MILAGLTFGSSIIRAQDAVSNREVLHFDAAWWHQASSDEQQGFIYGYRDCHQPANAPIVSIVDEQTFVSNAINTQKPTMPDAVTAAIHLAWKTMNSQEVPKNAEVFSGPHGFLDGEWWGEFEGRPWPSNLADADRGYLEGYLDCAAAPVTIQTVSRYQSLLNQHYASGRHSHDKIALVLQRLLKTVGDSQQ